jgi:hypothetical protein
MFKLNFIASNFYFSYWGFQKVPYCSFSVWREGNNPDNHDVELVNELKKQDIPSELITTTGYGTPIKSGQSFVAHNIRMPAHYTKEKIKTAVAKLNGLTVEEVGTLWNKADKSLSKLIDNLATFDFKKLENELIQNNPKTSELVSLSLFKDNLPLASALATGRIAKKLSVSDIGRASTVTKIENDQGINSEQLTEIHKESVQIAKSSIITKKT